MNHSVDHVADRLLLLRLQPGRSQARAVSIGGYIPLAKAYGYEPVPRELSADEAKYILGAQANLWTEYIATPDYAEYMLFPRLLAFSESVWSPASGKDYEDFMRRLPYQLGRLDKQAVHYRIPGTRGSRGFLHDHGGSRRRRTALACSRGANPSTRSMGAIRPMPLHAMRRRCRFALPLGSKDDAERRCHRASRPA